MRRRVAAARIARLGTVLARSGAADRVYEFIEFDIPGVGRGRTEFGVDHAFPDEPFYVTIRPADEAPQTLRFRDIDEFAAYRSKDTIFAEPGSGFHTDLLEDAKTQARSRANPGDDWGGPVGNATIGGPTENQDVFSYVQRELHKRGWTVIEIHGEGPIKAFIPDSIPIPGDESFADEAFYTYGLMAFRPSR